MGLLSCRGGYLVSREREMKGRWGQYVVGGLLVALLAGCSSRPTDKGQQYKDGKINDPLELVNRPNAKGKPVNGKDFSDQLTAIQRASPSLYNRNTDTFQAVTNWLRAHADTRQHLL